MGLRRFDFRNNNRSVDPERSQRSGRERKNGYYFAGNVYAETNANVYSNGDTFADAIRSLRRPGSFQWQ